MVEPKSLEVRRNFSAEIYVLKPDEGGRSNPFFSGYKPQAFIRTADCSAEIQLQGGVEMAMPGDNLEVKMKLHVPLPVVVGQRFALREGGRTIAAGVISELGEDSAADIQEEEERSAKSKAV